MSTHGDETWTVLRLLTWTKEYLARAELDSPRLAAEVLLAHVLGCERIDLYARFDTQPGPGPLAAFRSLVRRAKDHEPIAYLVGEKEFYSLKFKVTPAVLIPRPESELLVSEAVTHLRSLGRAATAWDACTGSGCVAVAVASEAPQATALATDISDAAVAVAAENVARHGLAERVRCRVADALALPADAEDLRPFDAITANPPYVREGEAVAPSVAHEPREALYAGADGLGCIRPIVRDAAALLRPDGLMAVEFGERMADDVRDLIAAAGAFAEPRILRDHQGIERIAVARCLGDEPH